MCSSAQTFEAFDHAFFRKENLKLGAYVCEFLLHGRARTVFLRVFPLRGEHAIVGDELVKLVEYARGGGNLRQRLVLVRTFLMNLLLDSCTVERRYRPV